jgi:CheY-like chemotaxis protein
VEDTGPGIAHGARQAIFEPFAQAGSSVSRQQGTGLGLSISRSFVRLMGGDLDLEEREGEGSLFRVRLPVQVAERGAPPAGEAPALTVVGLEPTPEPWRVLVVEDNEENRQLLETLLTRVGFRVRTAGNGLEGVEAADVFRPHFVWMDMKMPVMDGYEATRRIRSCPRGRKIGIYALTASVFNEQEETILAAGCNGVLHKPYREREIYEAMARHLGLHYRYAEKADENPADTGPAGAIPQPSDAELAALPPEMARRIHTAARELNKREIVTIASGLATTSPTLVAFLEGKATAYDFEAIAQLVASLHGEDI